MEINQIITRIQAQLERQTAAAKNHSGKVLSNAELANYFKLASDTLVPEGRTFVVDEENKEVINQLLYYFNRDTEFKGEHSKGIILCGNVGSGKTHLFKVFQLLALKPIAMTTCRNVERRFHEKGYPVLKDFAFKPVSNGTDKFVPAYCFDDLGAEANVKAFGNEVNVMAELIQDRYELWKSSGVVTHFTTNLTKSEISFRYGDRCLSRLQEMCTFVVLGTGENSKDRRL